jgi:hypothetical protein
VKIIEFQNMKYVNINRLRNLADMSRYFSEHWKF